MTVETQAGRMGRSFFGCSYEEAPAGTVSRDSLVKEVLEAIDIMSPKPCPYRFVRIGGQNDGAYLLPDDLADIDACFSPGVDNRKDFEDELAMDYGIKSHMCDFRSDVAQLKTPLLQGKQTFDKYWLEPYEKSDCVSLKEWVDSFSLTDSRDLILQMDIEGAEYRNLLACDDKTIDRFRIIVIEIHGLGSLLNDGIRRGIFLPFLHKLDKKFACIHAHPNNGSSQIFFHQARTSIPIVMELTFIRRDRLVLKSAEECHMPLIPHPLDITNNRKRKPIHLDGAWINYRQLEVESQLKVCQDEIEFLKVQNASCLEVLSGLIAGLAVNCRPNHVPLDEFRRKSHGDLVEIANGCKYTASSGLGNHAMHGTITDTGKKSYFFHTEIGMNQWIAIDLGVVHEISILKITNRLDAEGERARLLVATLSESEDDPSGQLFFLGSSPEFINRKAPLIVKFERGTRARYVKISSPLTTALHLSGIEVFSERSGVSG
jgi:hypothetical protein